MAVVTRDEAPAEIVRLVEELAAVFDWRDGTIEFRLEAGRLVDFGPADTAEWNWPAAPASSG